MLLRTIIHTSLQACRHVSVAMIFLVSVIALPQANAQTTAAVQDTTCVGNRSGNLTCSAGEFAVLPSFVAAPGTPEFCVAGQQLSMDVSIQLSGSNTDRYDIGFFTGQEGNDPRVTTAGNICSAAVVPPTSFPAGINPWYSDDGDTCGDLHETTPPPASDSVTWTVQNIKVLCQGTTSALSVPYVLSYSQSSSFQASCSALNVTNGAPSKCNSGTAQVNVGVNPIQVAGFVDVTKQTLPDGDSQSFSFTATGPVGSTLATSTDGGTTIVSAGSNTVTVSRTDGQTVRIYMSVISTSRTLSIVEAATTNWETSSSISCAAVTGSPTLTTNNTTRTATAALDTTNSAAACTFTNTKKSRITIAKTVGGRVNALDQFTVSASAGAGNTLTTDVGVATTSPLSVSTSGAGTSASTIFRSTPNLPLTITDAMAGGSVSALSDYGTSLTCINDFGGSGATPNASLPINSNVSTFNLTPAPGDDITCTYTNTPKPRITLQKAIAAAGGGRVSGTDQFALTAGTSTGTTTGTGATVTSGALLFVGTAGNAVTLSEAAAGTTNLANYDSSISCTNSNGASATVLPSGSGTSFSLTPANGDLISCTLTNTRKATTLSLRKVWVDAVIGETATVTSSGFTNNATSGLSTSTGNNTTTGSPVSVFANESGTISEVLSNSSNYNAVLSCSGNTNALVGNTLTVNAADTAIVCTQTNTRKSATLTLRKVWVNALSGETATVTSSGFTNNATSGLSTSTGNNTTTGSPVTVFANESGTISEVLSNSGSYTAVLSCSGNTTALAGNTLTINVADAVIVCDFTNTLTAAPAQTIVKSAATLSNDADGNGVVSQGDTLSYSVTVTNTGNVALTNVQINDAQLTPNTTTCASVAVAATCVLNGTHVVSAGEATAGQVVNTATTTSTEIPGPTSSNTVTTTVVRRSQTIVKSAATLSNDADGNGVVSQGDTF